MLFADLLSLHLLTFVMFFILVHVTFLSRRRSAETQCWVRIRLYAKLERMRDGFY